jgi:hypothetical protein
MGKSSQVITMLVIVTLLVMGFTMMVMVMMLVIARVQLLSLIDSSFLHLLLFRPISWNYFFIQKKYKQQRKQ